MVQLNVDRLYTAAFRSGVLDRFWRDVRDTYREGYLSHEEVSFIKARAAALRSVLTPPAAASKCGRNSDSCR